MYSGSPVDREQESFLTANGTYYDEEPPRERDVSMMEPEIFLRTRILPISPSPETHSFHPPTSCSVSPTPYSYRPLSSDRMCESSSTARADSIVTTKYWDRIHQLERLTLLQEESLQRTQHRLDEKSCITDLHTQWFNRFLHNVMIVPLDPENSRTCHPMLKRFLEGHCRELESEYVTRCETGRNKFLHDLQRQFEMHLADIVEHVETMSERSARAAMEDVVQKWSRKLDEQVTELYNSIDQRETWFGSRSSAPSPHSSGPGRRSIGADIPGTSEEAQPRRSFGVPLRIKDVNPIPKSRTSDKSETPNHRVTSRRTSRSVESTSRARTSADRSASVCSPKGRDESSRSVQTFGVPESMRQAPVASKELETANEHTEFLREIDRFIHSSVSPIPHREPKNAGRFLLDEEEEEDDFFLLTPNTRKPSDSPPGEGVFRSDSKLNLESNSHERTTEGIECTPQSLKKRLIVGVRINAPRPSGSPPHHKSCTPSDSCTRRLEGGSRSPSVSMSTTAPRQRVCASRSTRRLSPSLSFLSSSEPREVSRGCDTEDPVSPAPFPPTFTSVAIPSLPISTTGSTRHGYEFLAQSMESQKSARSGGRRKSSDNENRSLSPPSSMSTSQATADGLSSTRRIAQVNTTTNLSGSVFPSMTTATRWRIVTNATVTSAQDAKSTSVSDEASSRSGSSDRRASLMHASEGPIRREKWTAVPVSSSAGTSANVHPQQTQITARGNFPTSTVDTMAMDRPWVQEDQSVLVDRGAVSFSPSVRRNTTVSTSSMERKRSQRNRNQNLPITQGSATHPSTSVPSKFSLPQSAALHYLLRLRAPTVAVRNLLQVVSYLLGFPDTATLRAHARDVDRRLYLFSPCSLTDTTGALARIRSFFASTSYYPVVEASAEAGQIYEWVRDVAFRITILNEDGPDEDGSRRENNQQQNLVSTKVNRWDIGNRTEGQNKTPREHIASNSTCPASNIQQIATADQILTQAAALSVSIRAPSTFDHRSVSVQR